MTAFKALIIKDLQANRKALMVPIWYLLAMYVIIGGSMIFAAISGHSNLAVNGIPLEMLSNDHLHKLVSFVMQLAMFFSFLGMIIVIAMSIISSTMLNQDIKHKCEIFHRSQPVSIWQITASRFVAAIGGPLVLALGIAIINMLLSNIVLTAATPMRVDWWMCLNGMLLSWLHFSVALMVLGSILFFFSSVFKENAFGLGVGGLALLQLVTFILNKAYGWKIPYIVNAIYRLIISGVYRIQTSLTDTFQLWMAKASSNGEPNFGLYKLPEHFLADMWGTLFHWDMLIKLGFCLVMFIIATCLYNRREVQF